MKKILALASAVVAAGALVAVWQSPGLRDQIGFGTEGTTAQAPGAPSTPAQPPGEAQVAAAPASAPVEEVHESPDTETTLERLIPRESRGHAAGLHKAPDPLRLGSSAALVVDASTKEVLYRKNEQAVLPIASVTKLMTAVVIAESKVDMDGVITITEDDIDRERSSRSRLKVGTVLTRNEALHLALMSSENRAAHALGRTYPEGLDAFVKAMNRKAQELGMAQTRYVDPTGLSSDNQSSARDLATLVVAAAKYPLLREFSTDRVHVTPVGSRTLQYNNSNRLVKNSRWDIELQKTGYIVEAGHCVVMLTRMGGREVAMVLLDASNNGARSADAERIRHFVAGPDEPERKVAVARDKDRKQVAAKKDDTHEPAPKKADSRKTAAKKPEPKKQAVAKSTAKPAAKAASASATARKKEAERQAKKGERVKASFS